MEKIIEITGVKAPFRIKSITAKENNQLVRKNTGLLNQINSMNYIEDLVFACVDYPQFSTKDELTESLLPGQFTELSEQIQVLLGFEFERERKEWKSGRLKR